jgi:hypothetical protein
MLVTVQEAIRDVAHRLSVLTDQNSRNKEWHSVAEAALILGKAEFTVREWRRLDRINALKRDCGRGGKREWMISHQELERIRNKGLLPLAKNKRGASLPRDGS